MKRTYYRTVKNNRVRILGKELFCQHLQKHELDGRRFCFIIYNNIPGEGWFKDGLTCLWGTEAYAKAMNKQIPETDRVILVSEEERILAPDGSYSWYWWAEDNKEQGKEGCDVWTQEEVEEILRYEQIRERGQ